MKCRDVEVWLVLAFVSVGGTCFAQASAQNSGNAQQASAGGPREVTNSIGMKLVLIPAGEFMMGSGESGEAIAAAFSQFGKNADWFSDEFPRHRVRITKPFYFGRYEVTNAEFSKFVEATGYKTQAERTEVHPFGSGGWGFNASEQKFEGRNPKYNWRNPGFATPPNGPVVDVTWNDAVAFCRWLGECEGKTYRLPTEAEWEYAARAGTTARYWPGDDPNSLARVANTADASFFHAYPKYYPQDRCVAADDGHVFPATVGSYPPNPWGLYDVHGNVWEWTADWHADEYYARSPVDDPTGPTTGEHKARRGGAWHSAPLYCRVSFRNYNTVESRYPNLGFRVVKNAE